MTAGSQAHAADAAAEVVIYTDGACKGNPGVGGWGALLRFGGHRGVEWGAFRGDGKSVVTTGRCGTVCVWPTDPAAVARRLLPQSPSPPPAPPAAH